MKIFNEEKGTKKVYVQLNDIATLLQSYTQIPSYINERITNDNIVITDNNLMDFIEFSDPKEIEFFESVDWIIDYKELRDLSESEFKKKKDDIADEMNRIMEGFSVLSDEEKGRLITVYNLLNYKLMYMCEIERVKKGTYKMPFPVVPDSDGFSFIGDKDFEYTIKASLDPNKILLFRKDGEKLSPHEQIPVGFIQMGMTIAMMEKKDSNVFSGTFEVSHSLSEDNQYFVTEFKARNYDEVIEEQEIQKEEKGLRRIFGKLFNKRKN